MVISHRKEVNKMEKREIEKELLKLKRMKKSYWLNGVISYAFDLIEGFEDDYDFGLDCETVLLNGASSWDEYSWGGLSCLCDRYIALRLCTPSELKKTKDGSLPPNKREKWLDVQARALYQACLIIRSIIRRA